MFRAQGLTLTGLSTSVALATGADPAVAAQGGQSAPAPKASAPPSARMTVSPPASGSLLTGWRPSGESSA